jgi:hypothetical protein
LRSLHDRTGLEERPTSPFQLRARVPGHDARDFYEPLISIHSRDFR